MLSFSYKNSQLLILSMLSEDSCQKIRRKVIQCHERIKTEENDFYLKSSQW